LERLTAVAPRAPGRWQIATVASVKQETPSVKSFRLTVPMWMPHLPGQHYDVRLTASDGYQAQRSYSIASSPLTEGEIELTIDCLLDGEVSPYFHDVVVEGDRVELRGPFTSYFVWRGEAPVVLVGGGSGVVPLMAMIRTRDGVSPTSFRLLYSVRNPEDRIYNQELGRRVTEDGGLDIAFLYTRTAPAGETRPTGRINAKDLLTYGWPADVEPSCYVCGPTPFVETVADLLIDLGHNPTRIRTERFGPTGP
jgi:ferredoxin-NADP reductase